MSKKAVRRKRKVRWNNVLLLGCSILALYGLAHISIKTLIAKEIVEPEEIKEREVQDKPVVFIDPGHGVIDGGASNGIIFENQIVMSVALFVKEELGSDYEVHFSRENSEEVSWNEWDEVEDLQTRIDMAMDVNAELFISIHCNYLEDYAYGLEIWHSPKHEEIASLFLDELTSLSFISNRGLRSTSIAPLHILDYNPIDNVLLELGFISHAEDAAYLNSSRHQKEMGIKIANAIRSLLPVAQA